jgi:hypothetical protein
MDEVGRQRQIDKASKRQIEEMKKFMVIRERRRIDKGEKKRTTDAGRQLRKRLTMLGMQRHICSR